MENQQTEIFEDWFLKELELIQRRIDREDACFRDELDWRQVGF